MDRPLTGITSMSGRSPDWPAPYPANARFLDAHDLVVSKLAASGDKGRAFVAVLIETNLVEPAIIRERVALLPDQVPAIVSERIQTWLDSISPTR
ncbi:MAG: hypothetical protein WKF82_11320 [Nocardioidaceae bacterium]